MARVHLYLYNISWYVVSTKETSTPCFSVDTECLYTQVTQGILDRYGLTFDWALKARMMGRRPMEGAKILVDSLNLPMTPEEFHSELYATLMDIFPEAKLLPGNFYFIAFTKMYE